MQTECKRVCVICGELRSAVTVANFPTVVACEPCSFKGYSRYVIPSGLGNRTANEVNAHIAALEKELGEATDDQP
jgi:hypothetical protein